MQKFHLQVKLKNRGHENMFSIKKKDKERRRRRRRIRERRLHGQGLILKKTTMQDNLRG